MKDEKEVEQISQFLLSHIDFLRELFAVKASFSKFPQINLLKYLPLVQEMGIIDQGFEQGTVDRIFIGITKNLEKELRGVLSEKDMSRFQFYESIVRLAFYKYKATGVYPSTFESLKHLVEQNMLPNFSNASWMPWRKEKLWTLAVNDLYTSNLGSMQALYQLNFKQ